TEITAVEWNAKSIGYIKEIISKLGVKMVLKQNKVLKYLKKSEDSYDIIFADPPYNAAQEIKELIDLLASGQYLKPGGVFILEHQTMAAIQHPAIIEKREYGQSTFSFFKFEDKQ
ncbi:MAG: RsmD family RNA methyltransferase, partial [Bacteroidia bacterium]